MARARGRLGAGSGLSAPSLEPSRTLAHLRQGALTRVARPGAARARARPPVSPGLAPRARPSTSVAAPRPGPLGAWPFFTTL
jgi:hypothetical protein